MFYVQVLKLVYKETRRQAHQETVSLWNDKEFRHNCAFPRISCITLTAGYKLGHSS